MTKQQKPKQIDLIKEALTDDELLWEAIDEYILPANLRDVNSMITQLLANKEQQTALATYKKVQNEFKKRENTLWRKDEFDVWLEAEIKKLEMK